MTDPTHIAPEVAVDMHAAPRRSATYIGAFVLAGRVLERLAAFGQVLIVAAVFGSGYQADLYFIASVAPLLLGFVASDALAAAVLPVLVRLPRERRSDVAAAGFWVSCAVLGIVTLAYTAVATALVLIAHPAGGTVAPWLAFSTIIVTLGLSGYLSAVLLELERYVWPPFRLAAASVAGLVFTVVAATFFHGILALAIASAGGYLVSLLLMLVELRRALPGRCFVRPTRDGVRQILGTRRNTSRAALSGLIGGQVFVVLERLFAASAGVGAVATIAYARGVALAPNIAAQGVAGGIYPGMVRSHEAGHRADVGERFLRGLRLTLFFSVVMAAFLALYAHNISAFVFQRGKFGADTVAPVAAALIAFAPALIGNMLMILAWRVFYAVDFFSGAVISTAVALTAYLPLAVALREAFGPTGVAAAFGVAELTAAIFAVVLVARRLELATRTILATSTLPAAMRAGIVVACLVIYRRIVESVGIPVSLQGMVVVVGAAVVASAATAVALWWSSWPEVARVKSRVRGLIA